MDNRASLSNKPLQKDPADASLQRGTVELNSKKESEMKIVVAIAVVVVLVVIWFIWQCSRYMYVLQASVVARNPGEYSVKFEELHPETKPIEYVWLCLQLAAKLLYNMGNDPNQAETKHTLNSLIGILGDTDLSGDVNVLNTAGRSIRVSEDATTSGKKIVAKLAYVNPMTRLIWTSLPVTWFEHQFPDTLIAIVHTAIPRLDEVCRQRLQGSLARMAEIYAEGTDSSTLDALREVPHRAFMEARVIG